MIETNDYELDLRRKKQLLWYQQYQASVDNTAIGLISCSKASIVPVSPMEKAEVGGQMHDLKPIADNTSAHSSPTSRLTGTNSRKHCWQAGDTD